jgi:RHS repeat-associated protein
VPDPLVCEQRRSKADFMHSAGQTSTRLPVRRTQAETGLYYYRARYYDSNAGRFVSEDPVGFNAGPGFYRYVRNNPILLIDPTGLLEILPADPTKNTIICTELGDMTVQIGKPGSALQAKCTEDCVRAHEESHLADAKATNPKICKGQAKGAVIGFSNPDEQKVGEIKAYTLELDCLDKKMKDKERCKGCLQPLIDAILNAQERINDFKNQAH